MCKIKVQTNLYCGEVRKHKHEENKIIPQTNVEQIKGNGVLPLFIPLWKPS